MSVEQKARKRLKGKQKYDVGVAVEKRYKELFAARITKKEACRRLAEGLGFLPTVGAFSEALYFRGLPWPRTASDKDVFSNAELIEALIRDNFKLIAIAKKLGGDVESSATLVRWRQRKDANRASRDAKDSCPAGQGMLPLE